MKVLVLIFFALCFSVVFLLLHAFARRLTNNLSAFIQHLKGNCWSFAQGLTWSNLSFGSKLVITSACMAIISLFLEWADIYIFIWGLDTVTGNQLKAFTFLSLWFYPALMVFLGKSINTKWGVWSALIVMFIAVAFALYVPSKGWWIINVGAGMGVVLFFISGILLLFGVLLRGGPRLKLD